MRRVDLWAVAASVGERELSMRKIFLRYMSDLPSHSPYVKGWPTIHLVGLWPEF
jgi:hypothetical protein